MAMMPLSRTVYFGHVSSVRSRRRRFRSLHLVGASPTHLRHFLLHCSWSSLPVSFYGHRDSNRRACVTNLAFSPWTTVVVVVVDQETMAADRLQDDDVMKSLRMNCSSFSDRGDLLHYHYHHVSTMMTTMPLLLSRNVNCSVTHQVPNHSSLRWAVHEVSAAAAAAAAACICCSLDLPSLESSKCYSVTTTMDFCLLNFRR
mmetsp:Transcript_25923/g.61513  ORF Transcript_25923/g.61513 Transcript_25923/m.61513 type:complete len:201 (-) Transcript_25923:170-772(-)